MKTLVIIAMVVALFGSWGCKKIFQRLSRKISTVADSIAAGSGSITIDGVRLEHSSQHTIKQAYAGTRLIFDEGNCVFELSGQDAGEVELVVQVREFTPEDATVSFSDGKLLISTKSRKPATITRVEGKIPQSLNLDLEVGNGQIRLSKLKGNNSLKLESGNGQIGLDDCTFATGSAKIGNGSLTISNCTIEKMSAEVGVGTIVLRNSTIKERDLDIRVGEIVEE